MKLDFSKIDLTGFNKVPCVFSGVDCFLIYPEDIGVKWTEENKIFRSSIWTAEGEPVSLGYRKFVNYGESPDFEPLDITDPNLSFPTKIDGSCLIVSKFKGEVIIRTRQTTDARKMHNGDEIDYLIKKYPKAFDNSWLDNGHSCIYEWTTPTNVIVLRETEEPSLWLTGVIRHEDYSYLDQVSLDNLALIFWSVKRGKTFMFDSFQEMQEATEAFQDTEGIVIYSGDGQTLKKIKSFKYLYLHKLKSKLNSNKALIDFFLVSGCTDQASFRKVLEDKTDYEIYKAVEPMTFVIADIYKKVQNIVETISDFTKQLKEECPTRKEQALRILSKDKLHSCIYFMILDGQVLNIDKIKKLMFEELNLVNKEI